VVVNIRMTMIQYFVAVGIVGMLNAIVVIVLKITAPKLCARIIFRLIFAFTSLICIIVDGCLCIFFELAFENWSALSNPAELLTYHSVVLFSSLFLNLIAAIFLLIRVSDASQP
jgi:hypothetical protein